MDLLLFSLFFAALVIGYVLVHVRLTRFELLLGELRTLRSIDERLAQLGRDGERVRLGPIEQRLDSLHEAVGAVTAAIRRLERTNERPIVVEPGGAQLPARSYAEQLGDTIQQELQAQGFARVRCVTDLADLPPDEASEVVVECERQGMPHKGKLVVRAGRVEAVRVQSASATFP